MKAFAAKLLLKAAPKRYQLAKSTLLRKQETYMRTLKLYKEMRAIYLPAGGPRRKEGPHGGSMRSDPNVTKTHPSSSKEASPNTLHELALHVNECAETCTLPRWHTHLEVVPSSASNKNAAAADDATPSPM